MKCKRARVWIVEWANRGSSVWQPIGDEPPQVDQVEAEAIKAKRERTLRHNDYRVACYERVEPKRRSR